MKSEAERQQAVMGQVAFQQSASNQAGLARIGAGNEMHMRLRCLEIASAAPLSPKGVIGMAREYFAFVSGDDE